MSTSRTRLTALYFIAGVISSTLGEVAVKLTGVGFHRQLELNFQPSQITADCSYGWRWTMPAGLYVDADELAKSRDYDFCTSEQPRIEWMQKNAFAYEVYVFPTRGMYSVSVPLHVRYHSPRMNATIATADITDPVKIKNCHRDCDALSRVHVPCDIGRRTGQWCLFDAGAAGKLTFKVPVGNLKHLPYVAILTSLVTLGGFLYIVI